jgi:hypothetical protein
MPFVIGGFAAMIALSAGILAHVDPFTSLWRAALAFVLGWIGATVWYVLTTSAMPQAMEESDYPAASPHEASTS